MDNYKKYTKFRECFGNIEDIFSDFSEHTKFRNNQRKRHIILPPRDKQNPCVVVVAHLDTVQVKATGIAAEDRNFYYGAGFDDRTGFNLAMRLYFDSGFDNVGVLLTDNEEIGASTAAFAVNTLSKWNISFLLELDRAGNDYVTYDYENKALETIVEELGPCAGMGSFSDICMMEELDVAGINLGVGYMYAHSKQSVQSKPMLEACYNTSVALLDIVKCEGMVFPNEGKHWAPLQSGSSNGGLKYTGTGFYDDDLDDLDEDYPDEKDLEDMTLEEFLEWEQMEAEKAEKDPYEYLNKIEG